MFQRFLRATSAFCYVKTRKLNSKKKSFDRSTEPPESIKLLDKLLTLKIGAFSSARKVVDGKKKHRRTRSRYHFSLRSESKNLTRENTFHRRVCILRTRIRFTPECLNIRISIKSSIPDYYTNHLNIGVLGDDNADRKAAISVDETSRCRPFREPEEKSFFLTTPNSTRIIVDPYYFMHLRDV